MRRKAAATPVHPHVQGLLRLLPAADDRRQRSFVLASSAAAATALRDAVLAHRPGMLGVRFLTPTAFVTELLWLLREPAQDASLTPLAERGLLRAVLRATDNEVAAYALRHRPSLSALLATCREWLRGGAPSAQAAVSGWGQQTLAVAGALARALLAHPFDNRTKGIAAARCRLERGERPRHDLLVATVGDPMTADLEALLDALTRHVPATVLTHLPACELTPKLPTRSAHPTLEAELRAAAHRCGLALGDGQALRDMIVAAPRLGPYVPFLASAFAAEGIPLRAHAETALAHEPRGALAVHAARLLFDGAPTRSYLALAGADLQRAPLPPAEHHALEVEARSRGLAGHAALPERLAELLHERAPLAAAAVRRLATRAHAAAALQTSAQKARALDELLANELVAAAPGSRDADAAERLGETLRELLHADDAEFLLDALDLLQGRGLPIGARIGHAVQVVEYGDALAFPALHVSLLGAADDQLPQPTPPPTFFSDADREALGLPSRVATRAQQAQTLAQLASLPLASLHVSRPQTDTQGRVVGPSPLLATVLDDRLAGVVEHIERAHPLPRAAARVASGLAALDTAVTLLALQHGTAAAASKLLGARGSQTIKRVQRLEHFGGDLLCDGDIGDARRGDDTGTLSVSDLEMLARCAHQFFFRRELRVEALPPEPDALALAPGAVGSAVHALMAELHPRLVAAAGDATDIDATLLASELAPRLDAMLRANSPLAHTLPALHRILVRQWSRAVALSFADDARALRSYGITPLHQEHKMEGRVALGGGRELAMRGRADRIDRLADGSLRVIDYKTGNNPGAVLSTSDILKGRRLQMPVYAAMAEQTLNAELRDLGVRAVQPELLANGEFWLKWRYASDFLGGKFSDALRETLRVLADVRATGTFVPSNDANKVCRFCDFRAACRRLHPPSRERVFNSDRAEVRRYLGLRSKSIYAPMLGGVGLGGASAS